jgi:sugar/nucleoside kinase (ribokinase family)
MQNGMKAINRSMSGSKRGYTRDKRFDVIVVGEINPDLILSGDVAPEFGQVEKLVDDATLTIGSSSAIFACGAARLGLRVAIIGKIGDDEFGRFMLQSLGDRGIDTSGVVIDQTIHTGLSVILSRGNDRAILTYPGAIPCLSFQDIQLDLVNKARHLHLGSYFIQDRLRPDVPKLFEMARQGGLTVSLDTNFDPSGNWDGGLSEALRNTDVFLPNEAECCAIAGVQDVNQALNRLIEMVKVVVVKVGARGAIARYREDNQQTSGFARAESLSVEVTDTVGAGDSFDAGFLYGYLNGWVIKRTLRLGTVCGALSTMKAGGTTAQPTLAEAIQYM